MDHPGHDADPPANLDRASCPIEQPSSENHPPIYGPRALYRGCRHSGWLSHNHQRCVSPVYRQTTMLPPPVWDTMYPSDTTPIIFPHTWRLWCLWTSPVDKKLWWASADDALTKFTFATCLESVPAHDSFAVAQRNDVVHVVTVAGSKFDHITINHVANFWGVHVEPYGNPFPSARPVSRPSLAVFRGVLFLAWIGYGRPWYATLAADPTRSWSRPIRVKAGVDSSMRFQAAPALLVWHNRLFLHCVPRKGALLCCEYNYRTATWLPCERYPTRGAAIETLGAIHDGSATSYGDTSFLASLEPIDSSDGQTTRVAVRSFTKDKLNLDETVATLKRTPDRPPQLAVFNGKLHCIFIQITPTGERTLLWFSRPLLSFYLWCWMSHHHDRTPLSNLTIPGAHDHKITWCVPLFQQLDLGIRFFDFRL